MILNKPKYETLRTPSSICKYPFPRYICKDGDTLFIIDHRLWKSNPLFCREHERNIIDKFISLVKNLGIRGSFYDVGAAFGLWSLKIKEMVDRIVAIEPDPCMRLLLEETIMVNNANNVIVLPFAVGNKRGSARLCVSNIPGWSSLDENATRKDQCLEDIDVEVATLEDIVYYTGVPPTLVKIDVEGAEEDVILSGQEVIKEFTELMVVEVHQKSVDRIEEILKLLNFNIETYYFGHQPYIFATKRR